ncbi:MAG: hypothetical protein FJZ87_11030 [Chloroflexi bacterium]|nr:hypothetical protein [Chloroflexota bacterium]
MFLDHAKNDLTQVLVANTTFYGHDLGQIFQMSGNTPEYFLGDALGSVRQLTDPAGAITLAKSCAPNGEVTYPPARWAPSSISVLGVWGHRARSTADW